MNWHEDIVAPLRNSVALKLEDFPKYLEINLKEKYDHLGLVRTIVDQHKAVPIDSVYVESVFTQGEAQISESELTNLVEGGEAFTIEGFGGAGKSIFTRKLWRNLAVRAKKIPLLIELRNLPSDMSLNDFILNDVFRGGNLTRPQLEMLLDDGRFVILLDGFDEIGRLLKRSVERQIVELADSYQKTGIIVTGRPDGRFTSWERFQSLKVAPFTYEQFYELVGKINFDPTVKSIFQKKADQKFFGKHREFLSNPLLSLMMLVSFGENAEIPSKLSVFYKQCFDALFRKHDAMKQLYDRERTLDRISFERLFSVFSFTSHQEKKTTFGEKYFNDTLQSSIDYLSLPQEEKTGIETDILESVNLIAKEGDIYFYIHRSFQEYFAACCVTNVMVSEAAEAIAQLADDNNSTAFRLCCEMHEDLVKEKYLIPEYERLRHVLPVKEVNEEGILAVEVQGGNGYISVSIIEDDDGEKNVELNGWNFFLSPECDRLYKCVSALGGEWFDRVQAISSLYTTVPRPLCHVFQTTKESIRRFPPSGKVFISIKNGNLDFDISGVQDDGVAKDVQEILDNAKDECMLNLSVLNKAVAEFNSFMSSKLITRRAKGLLLRP